MVVDTNIIIACLKGESVANVLSAWKKEGRALFVSSITVAETLSLPKLSQSEILKIRAFLSNFIPAPFDDAIAVLAAALRRSYGLEIPDAGIAATALSRGIPLATRDNQFLKIKEIKVIVI